MDDIRNSNSLYVTRGTASIQAPIRFTFEPLPDITTFELATLLPYMLGSWMYQENLDKLGTATRHIKRL